MSMLKTTTAARRFLALCAAALLSTAGHGERLQGLVVSVADGDTVTVLDGQKHQHRVRLAGIDAPEKRQAFGTRSREHLARLVFKHQVTVDWHKTDRYGRIVGKVQVGKIDTGYAQLDAGLAWHYKQYAREQSPEDRSAYARAEDKARHRRLGLWADAKPTPPWEFRRPTLK